ncbi:MAG: DUF3306 domain-containing protein [Burkholderiales bacterium]|nr:DUF3306 domain-containing protein [Burkholderiales bacterium]
MSGRGETFIGRWARRKLAEPDTREREDRRVQDERADAGEAAPVPAPAGDAAPGQLPADLPALETITPDSDFGRFMQPDVPAPARNAALKKLFADPRFNVMDGLDTYIDDYTRPDPIPDAMLRELAQSQMLRLFEEASEATEATVPAASTPGGEPARGPLAASAVLETPLPGAPHAGAPAGGPAAAADAAALAPRRPDEGEAADR